MRGGGGGAGGGEGGGGGVDGEEEGEEEEDGFHSEPGQEMLGGTPSVIGDPGRWRAHDCAAHSERREGKLTALLSIKS